MHTFVTPAGDAVGVPIRRRPLPITPNQSQARRNAFWLHAVDHGIPDPVTGRPVRQSVRDLALLCNVTRQTVYDGIASARRLRTYVEEVAVGD